MLKEEQDQGNFHLGIWWKKEVSFDQGDYEDDLWLALQWGEFQDEYVELLTHPDS